MLEDSQVMYELHTYNLDENWPEKKDELEPKLMFGQLPLLEDGDFVSLVQTPSILRYLSRKLDILPSSLLDTARADMVADATQELYDRWMNKAMSLGGSNKAKRDYLRHAQRILNGLEKILKSKNEGKAYFISDTVRTSRCSNKAEMHGIVRTRPASSKLSTVRHCRTEISCHLLTLALHLDSP